ncbi:hypothetical protein LJ707_13285 [Mucilaginibacter sp. UR6-1]|uniref:hypothetical protein n=1 Tax=Mucilaginibacter sp. UR6-1 TaxID=1435643 RepID=UPI001E34114D|nr:hypothetical protein [Mucilaginibacter sp. UR6-1]MCC8409905.1 hypothetical protein [Mucilaginibacter sp. UR6-1]
MPRQSITSASRQARADALSQLDNIGSTRSEFSNEEVFTAMESDVANFIQRVQQNINDAGIANTGDIADLRMNVSNTGIEIIGKPYLIYQDKGVQGSVSNAKAPNSPFKYTDKKPPANSFKDYIKRKNLNLRNEEFYDSNAGSPFNNSEGDEAAINSIAFAMANSVYQTGLAPKNIFSKELPKLVDDVTKSVTNFAASFITSSIQDKYGNDLVKKASKK